MITLLHLIRLDEQLLKSQTDIKHRDNYIKIILDNFIDSNIKCSYFIGQLNNTIKSKP